MQGINSALDSASNSLHV